MLIREEYFISMLDTSPKMTDQINVLIHNGTEVLRANKPLIVIEAIWREQLCLFDCSSLAFI